MNRHSSIKTKMTLVLTGLLVLLSIVSSIVIFQGQTNEQKNTLETYQFTMVSILAKEIGEKMNVSHEALSKVAKQIPASYFDDQLKLQQYVESNASLYALFHNILIYSNAGVILAAYPNSSKYRGKDLSRLEYVQNTLKDGKPIVSTPFVSPVSKEPLIVMTAPIFDTDGKILGFIGGSQYFLQKNLLGNVMNAKIGETGYFYIITSNNTVLVHPNQKFILNIMAPEENSSFYDAARGGYEGTIEINSKISGRALLSMKTLDFSDWILVGVYPTKEAFAPIENSKKRLILVTLGTSVLTALIVWFIIQYLLSPLSVLHHHIQRVTGRLDDHSEIKIRWNDEIGKISNSFNEMMRENKRSESMRLEMEKQVRHQQKMESIGNLAGGVAHEFNNMLAIIIGNNELIMEELPQKSLARESTEEIRIAGLRARDVVKQLLTFSRHDDADQKAMDFKFVVQESVKLIRSSTPANIKIDQNLSADTYPVMGNDTQINQLLINLCNNAVDAIPDKGGEITIELSNETIDNQQIEHQTKLFPGQYAKLMVRDNGIGMDKKVLDRVFEPYFTTKDVGKGTGIGMAVVYGIVERHGGSIIVDSTPDRGTTFTIFFPAHEGLPEQETDERNILPTGDEYILYVDDESSIAKLGKRHLESLGYYTESITDPEKALDMVRNDPNKFDLLITDMAMPNMTGDQLVIEILKIRQDMPTVICTGYSAKISEKEAADIGAHSYIMKPINKSELAKIVRKVLDDAKNSNLVEP